jgi:hypothetical protein
MPEIILEWTFSPSNYFDEKQCIKESSYTIEIENGKAKAWVNPDVYEQDPENMESKIYKEIDNHFKGAQLIFFKSYNLSEHPVVNRQYPDGRKGIKIKMPTAKINLTVNPPDIVIKDSQGREKVNTRKERNERVRDFSSLIRKYGHDKTLEKVLNSYQKAVEDSDYEFSNLYDIRDALIKEFGKDYFAKKELNISGNDWSELGKLANYEAISQSRHKGEKDNLRSTTDTELREARRIALNMIQNYLDYLDKKSA